MAPFFNQSDEATVDGRQFAMAYYAELQAIPGFEVVPVGVVEEAMIQHVIDLSAPGEARRLAELLGVDAVVVGSVTDFSPYYPPRCGMRVEWYSANPGFHPIPAGYGLPWGTPEEEYIPESLVYEAEMELAKAQLATQTPDCSGNCTPLEAPPALPPAYVPGSMLPLDTFQRLPMQRPSTSDASEQNLDDPTQEPAPIQSIPDEAEPLPAPPQVPSQVNVEPSAKPMPQDESAVAADVSTEESTTQELPKESVGWRPQRRMTYKPGHTYAPSAITATDDPTTIPNPTSPLIEAAATANMFDVAPVNWPDARGFTPAGPSPTRAPCVPNLGPVITHTQIYHGHDPAFTSALASYVSFRDDARFGGWQSYLERSDDFIRFCAHLHLAEMLTARGGGDQTRVVRRWSESR